ncbi:hypothetical protein BMS3Abin07_01060 [bacterium BMS3Abin07]|nr:hypothetical protein BMS3Abin07_01060 [bacterium BMS3Abin07]
MKRKSHRGSERVSGVRRKYNLCLSVLINVLFISMTSLFVYAQSIEDISILKISPQDHRAVIKTPDGKDTIIKAGDSMGERGKVTEITAGRVVVEEKTETGIDKVIIRFDGKKQTVQRISRTVGKRPLFYAPVSTKGREEK